MTDRDAETIIRLLEEIRDGQKLQLERQAEAIAQQKERLAALDQATGGAQSLQSRSESAIQRSEQLIGRARFLGLIVFPILIVLLVFVCWLAFHRPGP